MITVEPQAAEQAKRLLAKLGKSNIRVRVLSGGCAGLEYKIEPADAPTSDDLSFQADGFQILVDRRSIIYVAGSQLTYESSLMKSTFKLVNPNATGSCSCGESFSV